jgi:HEAT repeat protein
VLALAVAAVVGADDYPRAALAQPPVPVRAQPEKKDADKKDADKKDPTKQPETKWPTEINGKDINAVMKDLEDPDPGIRLMAAGTLPQFGPAAQKEKVSKLLIKRMKAEYEKDPGVRSAVFTAVGVIQFESDLDLKEAVRLLSEIVDTNTPSSMTRMNAIQTLALFGHKGEPAITKLTGVAMTDPAFETRRSIAAALGQVGLNEKSGPNLNALKALVTLSKDASAAVRIAALQSLMNLGPPWDGVKKNAAAPLPPIDTKGAADIVKAMKARIGDAGAKPPTHGQEKDKHVEIWARLVVMEFDPQELNDDNLNALGQYLTGPDLDLKALALQAFGILGEGAGKRYKDVVRVMEEKGAPFPIIVTSIHTLGAMGIGAKPALPNLRTFLGEKKKAFDEKVQKIKELEAAKKPLEPQLVGETLELEGLVKTLEAAIRHIEESKSTSPTAVSDPPKKP